MSGRWVRLDPIEQYGEAASAQGALRDALIELHERTKAHRCGTPSGTEYAINECGPDCFVDRALATGARADEEATSRVNEDQVMALASADNPRSRQHMETRSDGYTAWRCVPIKDIVFLRDAYLAVPSTPPSQGWPSVEDEQAVEQLALAIHTSAARSPGCKVLPFDPYHRERDGKAARDILAALRGKP